MAPHLAAQISEVRALAFLSPLLGFVTCVIPAGMATPSEVSGEQAVGAAEHTQVGGWGTAPGQQALLGLSRPELFPAASPAPRSRRDWDPHILRAGGSELSARTEQGQEGLWTRRPVRYLRHK